MPMIEATTIRFAPAAAPARCRLRAEAVKNAVASAWSGEGPVAVSTIVSTPVRAWLSPSPVTTSTPSERDIATTSWPRDSRISTSGRPTRPVAPATAIFAFCCISASRESIAPYSEDRPRRGDVTARAPAGCVSNDLFREARADGIELASVRVVVRGDFEGDPPVSTEVLYDVEVSGNAQRDQRDRSSAPRQPGIARSRQPRPSARLEQHHRRLGDLRRGRHSGCDARRLSRAVADDRHPLAGAPAGLAERRTQPGQGGRRGVVRRMGGDRV